MSSKSQDEASLEIAFDEANVKGPLHDALQRGKDLMPSGEDTPGLLRWKCLVFVATHNEQTPGRADFDAFMAAANNVASLHHANAITLHEDLCGTLKANGMSWSNATTATGLSAIEDEGQRDRAWAALTRWTMSKSDPYNAFTIKTRDVWTALINPQTGPWIFFSANIGNTRRGETLVKTLFPALGDKTPDSISFPVVVTREAFGNACGLYNSSSGDWKKITGVSDGDDKANQKNQDTTFEAGKTLETFAIDIAVQSFIHLHRFLSSIEGFCRSNSREIAASQKQPQLVHVSALIDKIY